jgi:thiamine-phosphate pyrophosphorylase
MRAKRELLRDVRLYLLTDRELSLGRSEVEVVGRALAGGVDMVQYREKELSTEDVKKTALRLLEITSERGVPLIINDRVEVAAEIGAEGVHVGQEDLDCRKAREIVGEEKIIGVSAHDLKQALRAIEAGADYLGVGPIYRTETKKIDYPRGLGLIEKIRKESPIPIFAIGGIAVDNVAEVISAGASGVAVLSAIVSSEEITATCRRFVAEIEKSRAGETS